MGDDDYEQKVQLSFNFNQAERLGRIQRAVLPKAERCSPATMKSILNYLNTFPPGKCYPGEPRISEATQISLRQIKRGVTALKLLGVICVERRKCPEGYTCNHYALVWSELELLGRTRPMHPGTSELATRRPATRPVMETSPSLSDADHTGECGATVIDQSATLIDQSATVIDQSATVSAYSIKQENTNILLLQPPIQRNVYWGAAVVALMGLGIGGYRKVIECAQARQLTEADFLGQLRLGLTIIDLPANASIIRDKIKTLAWFLREGMWPCAVLSPGDQAQRDQTQAAKRDEQIKEGRLFHLINAGRRKRVPDEEIKRRVRMEIGEEFCRQRGW